MPTINMATNSVDKKEVFRKYLEKTKVVSLLTKTLTDLFEMDPRPPEPIKYLADRFQKEALKNAAKAQPQSPPSVAGSVLPASAKTMPLATPPTQKLPTSLKLKVPIRKPQHPQSPAALRMISPAAAALTKKIHSNSAAPAGMHPPSIPAINASYEAPPAQGASTAPTAASATASAAVPGVPAPSSIPSPAPGPTSTTVPLSAGVRPPGSGNLAQSVPPGAGAPPTQAAPVNEVPSTKAIKPEVKEEATEEGTKEGTKEARVGMDRAAVPHTKSAGNETNAAMKPAGETSQHSDGKVSGAKESSPVNAEQKNLTS